MQASLCPEKWGHIQHLLWCQDRGTERCSALQGAGAASSAQHPCTTVTFGKLPRLGHIYPNMRLSKEEWNVGCF